METHQETRLHPGRRIKYQGPPKDGRLKVGCEHGVLRLRAQGEGSRQVGVLQAARTHRFYEVAAAAASLRLAEGAFNKSCGQFHPLHGPELGLFIYGPGRAVGKSEGPGRGAGRRTDRNRKS